MERTLCKKCEGTGKFLDRFIPFAGGSMGFSFPAAVGFALAKKLKNEEGIIYCLMSDGEMQIGTTWESALIAAHHKLNNLIVIVDSNGFQAMGEIEDILDIGEGKHHDIEIKTSLWDKWLSFDWDVKHLSGHNYSNIHNRFSYENEFPRNKPLVFIAQTIKGMGVSFMEGENLFHYKQLSKEEYDNALQELNG